MKITLINKELINCLCTILYDLIVNNSQDSTKHFPPDNIGSKIGFYNKIDIRYSDIFKIPVDIRYRVITRSIPQHMYLRWSDRTF